MIKSALRTSLVFILVAAPASADPEWLKPNLELAECTALHWRSQPACMLHFNGQRMARVTDYLRTEIVNSTFASCELDRVLEAFEKREEAWFTYGGQACELRTHCIQGCGSGHSSSEASCAAAVSGERLEFLMNEVRDGLEIYGCPVMGATRRKTLTTASMEIHLFGDCENGLFFCENVRFLGRKKTGGEPLELLGRVWTEFDPYTTVDLQRGYEFESDALSYRVSSQGVLRVTDRATKKLVLEEKGTWK